MVGTCKKLHKRKCGELIEEDKKVELELCIGKPAPLLRVICSLPV